MEYWSHFEANGLLGHKLFWQRSRSNKLSVFRMSQSITRMLGMLWIPVNTPSLEPQRPIWMTGGLTLHRFVRETLPSGRHLETVLLVLGNRYWLDKKHWYHLSPTQYNYDIWIYGITMRNIRYHIIYSISCIMNGSLQGYFMILQRCWSQISWRPAAVGSDAQYLGCCCFWVPRDILLYDVICHIWSPFKTCIQIIYTFYYTMFNTYQSFFMCMFTLHVFFLFTFEYMHPLYFIDFI